jgi:hypothetical protein
MRILLIGLFMLSFNACAASNGGGGFVVGNPMMPASEGKEAAKHIKKAGDCVCKDAKATPPCECKPEEKKAAPDVKPVIKPEAKKKK